MDIVRKLNISERELFPVPPNAAKTELDASVSEVQELAVEFRTIFYLHQFAIIFSKYFKRCVFLTRTKRMHVWIDSRRNVGTSSRDVSVSETPAET
jgi:hypothetical protein